MLWIVIISIVHVRCVERNNETLQWLAQTDLSREFEFYDIFEVCVVT